MFAARLRAYAPGGAALGLLPDPLSWQASVVHGDLGALSVTYSTLSAGGALIGRPLADGLEVAVEVWDGADWVEPRGCRFVRVAQGADSADDMQVYSVTFRAYGWLLTKARLTAGTFTDGRRNFPAPLAGDLVGDILAENATIGGVPVSVIGGTTTDAAGAAWPTLPDQSFEYAADYLGIVRGLQEAGALDWATQARGLYLYLPDSTALSPTTGVRLTLGRDIGQAPADETIETLVSQVAVRAQAGGTVVVNEPTAPKPHGVWQGSLAVGQVDNQSAAEAMGQAELERSGHAREQYTRDLVLHDGAPVPLVDYWPGAWITAPTSVQAELVRVQQVTLTFGDGGYGGNVVLNDRLVESDIRRARTLATLTGGQVGSGGAPAPIAVDPEASRVPSTPTGLAATAAVVFQGPTPRGVVTATWNAVTTATDSGTLTISGYELQWRVGTGAWQTIVTPEVSAQIGNRTPGDTVETRVRAVGARTTLPSAWSVVDTVTVPGDVAPPPVPTTPTVSSRLGVITVTWDGGPAMPADFARVEVALGSTTTSTTVRGNLLRGGSLPITGEAYDVNRYARLRSVDTTGNVSAWSPVSVAVMATKTASADIDAAVNDAIEQARTGAVDGARLTPWTVLPDRVLVANVTNMIPWAPQGAGTAPHAAASGTTLNANLNTDVGWNVSVNAGGTGTDGTLGDAMVLQSGVTAPNGKANSFPVEAGKTYRIRAGFAFGGTAPSGLSRAARLVITFFDKAGSYISPSAVATPTVFPSYTEPIWADVLAQAPAGAFSAALAVQKNFWSAGVLRVVSPTLMVAMDSSLVVDGAITARTLAADSVTTNALAAGSVTGEVLSGELVISNKFTTSEESGQRVELDAGGFRMYDASDTVRVNLPTESGADPSFRGRVEADGLTVREGATFYSEWNEFARGAVVNLAEQVAGPVAGPQASIVWEGVQLTRQTFSGPLGTFMLDPSQVIGVGRDLRGGAQRVTVMQKRPGGTRKWFYDMNGALSNLLAGGVHQPFTDHVGWEVTGAVNSDTVDVWLGKWSENNLWYFYEGGANTYNHYPAVNPDDRITMGWNGTDILVAEKVPNDNYQARLRRVDPKTNPATVTENVLTSGSYIYPAPLAMVYKGPADFGATRWVISGADDKQLRTFDTTGAWDSSRSWSPPAPKVGGFWNAPDARFYTLGADGVLYKHSTLTWTDSALDTWHVGQTFFNGASNNQTSLGAVAKFTMQKRAQVKFTMADVPYSGEAGDPDSWKLFGKRGAAPLGNRSDMFLMASGGHAALSYTRATAPPTTGDIPPEFGTFPGATPAILRSQRVFASDATKSVLELRGDGSGHWGSIEVDRAGNVTLGPRSTHTLALTGVDSPDMKVWARGDVGGIIGQFTLNTSTAQGAQIGTIPAGLRPPQNTHLALDPASANPARVFVLLNASTGAINLYVFGTNSASIVRGSASWPMSLT